MDISEVKAALGKRVRYKNDRLFCDADYILTGCIIRRSERGTFFYQAEIQDLRQQNSVSIVSLSDLTRKEDAPK
jgi:hypothetical protein